MHSTYYWKISIKLGSQTAWDSNTWSDSMIRMYPKIGGMFCICLLQVLSLINRVALVIHSLSAIPRRSCRYCDDDFVGRNPAIYIRLDLMKACGIPFGRRMGNFTSTNMSYCTLCRLVERNIYWRSIRLSNTYVTFPFLLRFFVIFFQAREHSVFLYLNCNAVTRTMPYDITNVIPDC